MNKLEKLLPCPGCGDTKPRLMGRDAGFVYCSNEECGWEVRSPEPYCDAVAVRIWNTRYKPPLRIEPAPPITLDERP